MGDWGNRNECYSGSEAELKVIGLEQSNVCVPSAAALSRGISRHFELKLSLATFRPWLPGGHSAQK